MNLIRLTQSEVNDLSYKVGDIHQFKSDYAHTARDISFFDIFKDIDSYNKDIYVAPKNDPYSNPIFTGLTLY